MHDTITTKIFREDLAALRELKQEHRLAGIADTISWLLDRHENVARRWDVRLAMLLRENEAGELSAEVVTVEK